MKIGIIGAGNVGGSLGTQWASRGHQIFFGVRNPQGPEMQELLAEIGSNARAGSVQEAAAFGAVVALAVHWDAMPSVLQQLRGLQGKIVIDCTNRMRPPEPGSAPTAGEEVARLLPGAVVVKAFNTIGAEHLNNPQFGEQQASMFIVGDDPAAKRVVAQLAEDLGFDVVEAGPLRNAGLLETLTRIWIQLSRQYGRGIAFKLLRQ